VIVKGDQGRHRAAATPSQWASTPGARRRRAPLGGTEGKPLDAPPCREVAERRALGSGLPGNRPSCRGVHTLQVGRAKAQGQAHPSAWTRARRATGRATQPRHRRAPAPRAARRTISPSPAGRCSARHAVQGWSADANHLLAPQREEGTPPADRELATAGAHRAAAGRLALRRAPGVHELT
jgi:hypothetical protein